MLPTAYNDDLTHDFTIEYLPSRTPGLDRKCQVCFGMVDTIQAVEQAVYLILNVERYQWLIYSWNYGVELRDLFGKPVRYCITEIERRIAEALLQDDRITAVQDFHFETIKRVVKTTFTVVSIFGEFGATMEVEI